LLESFDQAGRFREIKRPFIRGILPSEIDKGAERIFSAPPSLTGALYTKLEQMRAERDRLRAQLDDAKRQRDGTDHQEVKAVEEAISALRNLRGAFEKAEPSDTRELLASVVSRIDLFFDRHQHGKYTRTTFREGLIHVRPDPAFTNLSTTSRRSDLR
jgi:DNA repair exonuclease SbcCD ATPase subunit